MSDYLTDKLKVISNLVQSGLLLDAEKECMDLYANNSDNVQVVAKYSWILELKGEVERAQEIYLKEDVNIKSSISLLMKFMQFYLRHKMYVQAKYLLELALSANHQHHWSKKQVRKMQIIFNKHLQRHEANARLIDDYIYDYPNDYFGYNQKIGQLNTNQFRSDKVAWENLDILIRNKIGDAKFLERIEFILNNKGRNQIELRNQEIDNLNMIHLNDVTFQQIKRLMHLSIFDKTASSELLKSINNKSKWYDFVCVRKKIKFLKAIDSLNIRDGEQDIRDEEDATPHKIDVVVSWIDLSDERLLTKFIRQFGFNPMKINNEAHGRTRYSDNGELDINLLSLFLNIPALDRVFIVTHDQKPDFSSITIADHLLDKIVVVNQSDIIDRDLIIEDVWHSNLIESFIWRIPSLSEYFIYLCDDMVIGNTLLEDICFNKQGLPYAWLKPVEHEDYKNWVDLYKATNEEFIPWQTGRENAWKQYKLLNDEIPVLFDFHQAVLLVRSECERAYFKYLDLWKPKFFKEYLRGPDAVYPILIFLWESIRNEKQVYKNFIDLADKIEFYNNGINLEIVKHIIEEKPLFYCLNSLMDEDSIHYAELLKYKLMKQVNASYSKSF